MKKLIIAALAIAAATTMYAQGTVSMASKNAVTYGDSCGALAGQKVGDNITGYLLYDNNIVASQAFNGVNAKTGEWTGKMNGPVLTIDGVPAGQAVQLTVVATDLLTTGPLDGAVYIGTSTPFTYNTGNPNPAGGLPPITPDSKLAYDSFTVEYVPEPTTIALGILGLSSLLVLRRRD